MYLILNDTGCKPGTPRELLSYRETGHSVDIIFIALLFLL